MRILPRAKTILFSTLLVMFLTSSAFAQKDPPLGKPDMNELKMKKCEWDTNAPAMFLWNSQETEIETFASGDVRTIVKRRARIKIINERGYPYANVQLSLPTNRHKKITDISAFVYNLDSAGNAVVKKIDSKDIFKEKNGKRSTNVTFTFPDLKPGSIVEYTYTQIDKRSFYLPPWVFQSEIPTVTAICKITVPSVIKLTSRIISEQKLDTQIEVKKRNYAEKDIIYSYTAQKIPAITIEPMMGSLLDHIQRVEFSALPTTGLFALISLRKNGEWEVINALMNALADAASNLTLPGSDSIVASAKKLKAVPEKIAYIYSTLQKRIQWDGTQTFFPDEIMQAWKEKAGSSAELNMILLSLLRKADIDAKPILISTRDHGKADQSFVTLSQFNGIDLVVLDSPQNFVLDLSQRHLPFNITPYNVINTGGFLIDSPEGQWVEISDERPLFKQSVMIFSNIDSTGILKGTANIEYFHFAKENRLTEEDDEETRKNYRSFQEDNKLLKITKSERENENEIDLPLIERSEFNYELTEANNYYLLNPSFFAEFRLNPFTKNERKFDIDMGSNQSLIISLVVDLPSNLEVETLPKNVTLIKSDSGIIFKRLADRNGNTARSIITLQFLRYYYTREEYAEVKEFYEKMYNLLNEPIVFRRKEN